MYVTYQYGNIEKIIDFDSLNDEVAKVGATMEIDTITEILKNALINDGKRNYRKYTLEQVLLFIQIM